DRVDRDGGGEGVVGVIARGGMAGPAIRLLTDRQLLWLLSRGLARRGRQLDRRSRARPGPGGRPAGGGPPGGRPPLRAPHHAAPHSGGQRGRPQRPPQVCRCGLSFRSSPSAISWSTVLVVV